MMMMNIISRTTAPNLLNTRKLSLLHTAAKSGFKNSVNYHNSRPAVSQNTIDYILSDVILNGVSKSNSNVLESPSIVELGAGTGLFTTELLKGLTSKFGSIKTQLIINEPHLEMREKLIETIADVKERDKILVVDGSAAVVGGVDVPPGGEEYDIVVACQAFHW